MPHCVHQTCINEESYDIYSPYRGQSNDDDDDDEQQE